jgi:hypothetical protein
MKKDVNIKKKDKFMEIQNNPELLEYNSKVEKEVRINKTFENKILDDATQLTESENISNEIKIISAPFLKNE